MKLAFIFSFILSIVHSILFVEQEVGISVFLFVVTALIFLITVLDKQKKIKNRKALLLVVPILLLSATYFIFNNMFFKITNIFAILLLFLIMIIIATLGDLRPSRLIINIFDMLFGCVEETGNAAREFSNNFSVKKSNSKEKNKNTSFRKILKAILISLPLVIIVLVLLSVADKMFASIFKDIFVKLKDLINLETIYKLYGRIVIITLLTMYFMSFTLKIVHDGIRGNKETKAKLKIEGVTVSTTLTLLNIIYLVFAAVQVIHIIDYSKINSTFDYAGYARTGFFELMTVSLINFLVILITKNNKKEITKTTGKYIKIMNILLALFTVVILITSIMKIQMYEDQYGYTFLRIMVYMIQITELMLIIPTLVYIVKDKFKLSRWYLTIIVAMYLVVNFMNIDNIIAKGNVDRYFLGKGLEKKIDFYYLKRTSTDAIPEIIRLLNSNDKELRINVNNYLYEEYEKLKEKDVTFQNFNISEIRAKKQLEKLNLNHQTFNRLINGI